MSRVDLQKIRMVFGDRSVLQNIDLEIAQGDFVVVVGPSGCGKSTLLRIVAGLDKPSSGDLLIDGRSALEFSPAERGIAMVFQSYALYPHLTVYENMAFPLRLVRLDRQRIDDAVLRTAAMLDIEALLDRKPKSLSGGQRQRVAIGRAIIRQPKILLLDEPLSNLDASLRVHMRHEFARLHRELGTTTVYVTHDQVEAMTLADKIVVLNGGRVEQAGAPLSLYHNPENLFVAGFIGSPRMNLVPGRLTSLADGVAEVSLDGGERIRIAIDDGKGSPAVPGDRVVAGIRPASFHLVPTAGSNRLTVSVDVVENPGGAICVYGELEQLKTPLIASLPAGSAPVKGERLTLAFEPGDGYLFAESGRSFARRKLH